MNKVKGSQFSLSYNIFSAFIVHELITNIFVFRISCSFTTTPHYKVTDLIIIGSQNPTNKDYFVGIQAFVTSPLGPQLWRI